MTQWLGLIAGGIAGTISRYLVAGAVCSVVGTGFPYGTMIVNALGCFIAGFFITWMDGKMYLDSGTRLLIFTGFCGAFTTFSTFILETAQLMQRGATAAAVINVMGSILAGFAFFALGVMLAGLFIPQKA